MRSVLDNYPQDVLSIGEIHIFDLPEWASYYGENLDQLDMPFNFHLMASEWDAANVRAAVEAVLWNVPAGAWTNWTLGNHDEIRMASRIPNGQERLAGLLLLTLPGTPFIYYGDEIGMLQAEISESLRMDPWGRSAKWLSRDGERTPMQWEPGPNAGFTAKGVKSWLPIGPDHEKINVESELDEPGSLLNMYRRLLELRSNRAVIRNGTFLSHPGSSDAIFAYRRERDDETMTIILNFSEVSESLSVGPGRVVFSTHDPDRGGDVEHVVRLAAHEGVIVSHKPSGTPT